MGPPQSEPEPGPAPGHRLHQVDLVVFRARLPGQDPLATASKADLPARAHSKGEPLPLYAALLASTARLEFRKALGSAADAFPVCHVHRLEFSGVILDACAPDLQLQLGVDDVALTGPDMGSAQETARAAWRVSADGVLLPSAADKGAHCLVVRRAACAITLRPTGEVQALPLRVSE